MSLRVVSVLSAVLALGSTAAPPAVAEGARVDYQEWRSTRLLQGAHEGTAPVPGGLAIRRPVGVLDGYDYARWTSPRRVTGFAATQAVASWNADTPPGTWLQVELRGDGTPWYVMARWALGDRDIERTTVSGQSDEHGSVDVDTFLAARPLRAYQLRVTLYRLTGTRTSPLLRMAGAMASAIPDRFTVPTSAPGVARGVELPVPRYSQNVHEGHYPEYDGGGEAWCSPTSTAMVVEYHGRGPSADDLSWVDPDHADRTVDHAARHTYDHDYRGAGNWPFNTAYAATFGLRGHVTRLRSLSELEGYIARGVPVITSQSFREDELTGAGYGTAGHIMVVVGFTGDGDVIANDPASPSNDAVRRVYDRAQFENIWLRTKRHRADGSVASGSGGIAYIISR
ncbi:peptidase C39-like protein [Saccharothrix saharensis]|uniref:Peptidase C39-like protein n=1 Tax=Saccharothrix saharensis TaxID=571190 RepID=A0A543J9E8_9PSEU|nr:C39 family peptidase [Saccharothrix saharensis]TQM79414.1 peptidase C39-like protein [Saccharothrix saharensis]